MQYGFIILCPSKLYTSTKLKYKNNILHYVPKLKYETHLGTDKNSKIINYKKINTSPNLSVNETASFVLLKQY